MPFNANHGGYLYKTDSSGGFVCENPFSATGGAIEDKDLLTELMAEYLKAKNADLSEEERERMAGRLVAQRQERLSVLERFFLNS